MVAQHFIYCQKPALLAWKALFYVQLRNIQNGNYGEFSTPIVIFNKKWSLTLWFLYRPLCSCIDVSSRSQIVIIYIRRPIAHKIYNNRHLERLTLLLSHSCWRIKLKKKILFIWPGLQMSLFGTLEKLKCCTRALGRKTLSSIVITSPTFNA